MLSSTRYRFEILRAGPLWLDGGSMFGLIPRVVWSKLAPMDDRCRIEVAHNCLMLTRVDQPATKILIETGSGDKFDAKGRDVFGLADYSISDALEKGGTQPAEISQVIVSHLHFDHAGGVTRRVRDGETPDYEGKPGPDGRAWGVKFAFPNATIHVQRREWADAIANNSVMTRTYLRENLEPIHDRLKLIDSTPPYPAGRVPGRSEFPAQPVVDRMTEILPGIFTFLVPGHTWGQQAILFGDDQGRTIVFTPDVMPTVNHIGAAYNMAYDVEAYLSSNSRRWFLQSAVDHGWTLAIDHEPGNPIRKVRADGKGWFAFE